MCVHAREYRFTYIHVFIYAYVYTYIFVPRRLRSSAALRRGGMPHKAGHQEDTACVYHHVCTHIHVLTSSASAALAPCDSSFATVWPSATLSAYDPTHHPVKMHTLKRQYPAPSMLLLPAADHLIPIVHTEYHDHAPPPPPLLGRTPHTMHAPNRASCPTCRSRASASLVASISSFAAASCLFSHASHRAVWPNCTCVCVQMRHSTHARVWGAGGHQRWKEGGERG